MRKNFHNDKIIYDIVNGNDHSSYGSEITGTRKYRQFYGGNYSRREDSYTKTRSRSLDKLNQRNNLNIKYHNRRVNTETHLNIDPKYVFADHEFPDFWELPLPEQSITHTHTKSTGNNNSSNNSNILRDNNSDLKEMEYKTDVISEYSHTNNLNNNNNNNNHKRGKTVSFDISHAKLKSLTYGDEGSPDNNTKTNRKSKPKIHHSKHVSKSSKSLNIEGRPQKIIVEEPSLSHESHESMYHDYSTKDQQTKNEINNNNNDNNNNNNNNDNVT